MNASPGADARRGRLARTLPLVLVAVVAFFVGALLGGEPDVSEQARDFADAWERQDFAAMHAALDPASRAEHPPEDFERAYVESQATATAVQIVTDAVEPAETADGDAAVVETTVDTHAFGQVRGRVELPLGGEGGVVWQPHLVFPGLRQGELLDRVTSTEERAALLARDGTPLAEGPAAARSSPLGAAALAIAGSTGSPSRKQADALHARGFPGSTLTGTSGLELAFDERLAGRPGGQLVAVADGASASEGRILASTDPVPGRPVRTTIDPDLQQAAVSALGALYGGVAVLDAQNGEVLGIAGLAFSAPQPPGSTFKIITATAALDAGIVETTDEFPVEVSNSEIGREIANAHDAPCGGTFVQSFAKSCNTVFAPLGVRVGAERLVETSEAFGFNEPPALLAAEAQEALAPPASTIPDPIEGEVAVGESAIGQGQVLATPLQMASVSQTIANDGVRMPTSIARTRELRPDAEPVDATSPETAQTVADMMVEVVRSGTGTAAALPQVQVAGKTGTAELGPAPAAAGTDAEEVEEDAWFTAFAPAGNPRLAVAVMVVEASGGGGEVAAPIAADVLASAFG